MNVLACSDGHEAAERAIAFAARFLTASDTVTLLGIVEHPSDEAGLKEAMERQAAPLHRAQAAVSMVVRSGLPLVQIREEAAQAHYDWVVIGAEHRSGGPLALTVKAYHLIKELSPPVLAVMRECQGSERILLCSGGAGGLDTSIDFVGNLAARAQMGVTLLHVLAAPPPVYAGLADRESDAENLLKTSSRLGRILRGERQRLEMLGLQVKVKLRHGLVATEILREAAEGKHDLIVAGTAPTGAAFQTYVLGDITSQIVNGATCAVLVIRGGGLAKSLLERFRRWWSGAG